MKCIYTSDLHGEIHLYQELLSLAISASSEIILIGGDLLPSFSPTKRHEDMIPNQRVFIDQFLIPFFKRIFETTSVHQVFLIPGNWDLGYDDLFKNPPEKIIDLSQKSYSLENCYELIGYPFVPPTPFRPKTYEKMDDRQAPWPPQKNPSYIRPFEPSFDRSSDPAGKLIPVDPYLYLRGCETIREDLEKLPRPLHLKKTIYVMHSPPFETHLDSIQGGRSAGSRSIKAFIQKYQPLLTLHGHIHESPRLSGAFIERIGKTLSINPGQFTLSRRETSPVLHAVTFEMERAEETLRHTCF